MDGGFPSEAGQPFGGDQRERFRGTAENAKTKMCLRWEAGNCRFGERCNFAHGEHELRRLPPRSGGGAPSPGRGYGRGGEGPGGGGAPYYGGAPGGYGGGPGRGGGQFNGGFERPQYGGGYGGAPGYGGGIGGGMGSGMGMGGYAGGLAPPGGAGGGYGMQQQQHGGGEQGWGGGPAQGFPVAGTGDWTQYTAEDGQKYYHNHVSGETVWDAPAGWQPMHG